MEAATGSMVLDIQKRLRDFMAEGAVTSSHVAAGAGAGRERPAPARRRRPAAKAAKRPLPRVPGRYRTTKKGEELARLIAMFLSVFIRHPDRAFAGKPFVPEAWQRDKILRPIFGCVDRRGARKYREALLGLPRNSGKSSLSAALVLAIAFTEPIIEGEYVIVARNRPQAKIVFNKLRRMVYADPMLRAACEVRTNEVVVKETGQRIYTVAYDAGSAQGIHGQVVIIDEYHVHKDDSMRYAMLSGHDRPAERPAHHDLDRRRGAQGPALGAAQERAQGPARLRLLGRRRRRRRR